MSKSVLSSILKVAGNEYATIAEEGIIAGDITSWLDTGSYGLNALLSGSIYKGLAGNKILGLAGEPSVGKTYFALEICKNFLNANPNGFVVYFESESAISKDMLQNRKLDVSRILVLPVQTVEEFRTQATKIINEYISQKETDRAPMIFVLDSLGQLSTNKEMADIASGNDKRDMTKQQLIKGAFRALTLRLGKYNIPMIVTTHTYETQGDYIPKKVASGGSGMQYAGSQIIFLSKKKEKDNNEIVGSLITASLFKSRFTIENKKVETLLRYDSGLDKYFGLLDLAEKFGIVKKVSTKYEFPDGTKAFEIEIKRHPEKYFTKELLDSIDAVCPGEFLYGTVDYTGKTDVTINASAI